MHKDHERYCRACEYPGPINLVAAERHLHKYLRALGIKRHIMRLPMGWRLEDHPDLERHIAQILEKAFPQRAARDAMDAMDAMAARAARAAMAARDARGARAARDAREAWGGGWAGAGRAGSWGVSAESGVCAEAVE